MKQHSLYPTLLIIVFASCSGNKYKALTHELETSYSYDTKKIELTGYLNTGMFFTRVSDDYADMELCTNDDDTRNRNVITDKLKVHFGKEPNSVYFPEKFERKDVVVYDNAGKPLSLDNKVKVTGTIRYTDKIATGNTSATTLRAEIPKEKNNNDYTYVLENVTIIKI